jgi:hypothetical protein
MLMYFIFSFQLIQTYLFQTKNVGVTMNWVTKGLLKSNLVGYGDFEE